MEMLVFKHIQNRFYFSKTKDFMFQGLILSIFRHLLLNVLFQKNTNGSNLRTYFFEKSPGSFGFVTLPLEILEKVKLHLWISTKLCGSPWKFQGKKPKPMKIPRDFFLIAAENSTSFLTDPCNFNMLFL